jgi:hypothetical protein
MTPTQMVLLALGIIVVAVIVIGLIMRIRSKKLQDRFGPEYHRAIEETGSRYKAEAQLERLEKRVQGYLIRPLSGLDRDRFLQSWRAIQATFVDDPNGAVADADTLLGEVMSARGYPVSDFDQRVAEISVNHPIVVQNYRAGHDVVMRHSQGNATTEDLRQAMIHYRALFDELVGERQQEQERLRSRAAGVS